MHAVWNITELRLAIFEHLDPQDLARLTQTCSTLYDIATNELWRTVKSPAQLVSCLPEDFRLRPLRLEDIQRLDTYAYKVESISWESHCDVIRLPVQFSKRKNKGRRAKGKKTWEELWKEIADLRPSSQLLPYLRRLRLHNVIEELLWPFVGISGQNLAQIRINIIHDPQPDRIVTRLLESFQNTPKLEYLFVRDGEPNLAPSDLIRQAPLKKLRLDPRTTKLAFKPLRVEILHKSTLEHLTLGLNRNWFTQEIHALKGPYFPALRTLWLDLTKFNAASWTLLDNLQPGEVCLKRPASYFLKGLDNPELDLLNIKFPLDVDGSHFLDIVSAANGSCRLRNLKELAFAGGGWIPHCWECGQYPAPKISPPNLRQGVSMLLPLPQLKVLRLSIAPNFLDVWDLDLYKFFANGLPALERLSLGYAQFMSWSYFDGTAIFERVPLLHLAAFCSMLPNLVETSIGCADGEVLEERPQLQWACLGVRKLTVSNWAGYDISYERLHLNLRGYFPNSDLAKEGLDPDLEFFEQ